MDGFLIWFLIMDSKQTCTGTTSKNKPCKKKALDGTDRCRYHPHTTSKVTKPTRKPAKKSSSGKLLSTVTITFGDVAENHAGMEQLGELSDEGFSISDLQEAKQKFDDAGIKTELINLEPFLLDHEPKLGKKGDFKAAVLIARNGISALLDRKNAADLFLQEQAPLQVDKKAWMRGRVVNKHARYNLCFSEESRGPDYEHKKGRVIAFDELPLLKELRESLPDFYGEKAANLPAEGNYYYDTTKCGIGFHGDGERRKVIALRLGATIPIVYQWYYQGKPVGEQMRVDLNHGDMYIMSEKAAGFDWKRRVIPTLRHAAGCANYTLSKEKLLEKWNKNKSKRKKK